jgi:hypothetical protein
MRWEIKNNRPKIGDIRFVTKFAWFPTIVVSKMTMTDHMIWLELYIEEQEYKRCKSDYDYSLYDCWVTVAKTIHV